MIILVVLIIIKMLISIFRNTERKVIKNILFHDPIVKDSTKNKSSNRVYPLLSDVREILLRIKAQQEEYKKMFGNCYTETAYVFARPDGKMYYPSYPSKLLKKTLLKHNLKYIRFHDLRHSCASMLIMKGWQMKDISA